MCWFLSLSITFSRFIYVARVRISFHTSLSSFTFKPQVIIFSVLPSTLFHPPLNFWNTNPISFLLWFKCLNVWVRLWQFLAEASLQKYLIWPSVFPTFKKSGEFTWKSWFLASLTEFDHLATFVALPNGNNHLNLSKSLLHPVPPAQPVAGPANIWLSKPCLNGPSGSAGKRQD